MAEDTIHDQDPFAIFLKPPENETSAERATREAREVKAKKRSEEIDEELRKDRQRLMSPRGNVLKAVLIGNSDSGKSKMVKHLRMIYAREEWDAELAKWKCVIQLKILKAVATILDALQSELDGDSHSSEVADYPFDTRSCPGTTPSDEPNHSSSSADISAGEGASIQDRLWRLLHRLRPISLAQEYLRKRLEVSIEASSTHYPRKESEEATELISYCQEPIKTLWKDETVKSVLRKRKIKLEESAKFFLEDLDRIASRNFVPSDEDVDHVFPRTGIKEYLIKFEQTVDSDGRASEQYMRLYDIGSWGMSRHAWIPYLEGVHAVIFFASLSSFNEYLPEDPKVNRLEDSFRLWLTICKSFQLLKQSGLVLFLTEYDALRRKLNSGVKVKDYVPSYGDRPNNIEMVGKYFQQHFKEMSRKVRGVGHCLYIHVVSTVDIEAAGTVISDVKEAVLRENIRARNLV